MTACLMGYVKSIHKVKAASLRRRITFHTLTELKICRITESLEFAIKSELLLSE